jgi:hypothetical protein
MDGILTVAADGGASSLRVIEGALGLCVDTHALDGVMAASLGLSSRARSALLHIPA